jgi:two-component system sensor histidine kinase RegB
MARVSLSDRLRSPLLWNAAPDRWLIRLRWLALAGMATTTFVADWLVPGLRHRPLVALLGLILASNLVWLLIVRRGERLGIESGRTVAWQLAADVLLLGAVLWFSGGLDNPFTSFLTFQVVLSGLLATRATTIGVALLALAVAGLQYTAPPLRLDDAWLGAWRVRSLGNLFAVSALALVTGAFVVVFLRRLEVLRERSARSEQLAQLGRILAAMCHELNTPLGSILIAGKDLELIARPDSAPDSSEVSSLARTVTDQARRASDLIDLLRGQIRPGQVLESVDLGSFSAEYARSELSRLGWRGSLDVVTEGGLWAKVYRSALCQILTNLLRNAVDALGDKGRITLRAARGPAGVTVTVEDDGPGVDKRLQLGEPFQTTKADRAGTGLGLYASTLLAERMGGTLELDSRPGLTRVTLTLKPGRPTLEQPAIKDVA